MVKAGSRSHVAEVEAMASVFAVVLVAFEAKGVEVDVGAVEGGPEMVVVACWVVVELEGERLAASTTVDYLASSPAAFADVEVEGKAEGMLRWEELVVEHQEVVASALRLVGCKKEDSACMRSSEAALADAEAEPGSSSLSAHVQDVALLSNLAVTSQVVRVKVLAEIAA